MRIGLCIGLLALTLVGCGKSEPTCENMKYSVRSLGEREAELFVKYGIDDNGYVGGGEHTMDEWLKKWISGIENKDEVWKCYNNNHRGHNRK